MRTILALAVLLASPVLAAPGAGVTGSKHDLSITGPGPFKSDSETEVCIFCHVSHGSGRGLTSRPDPAPVHSPYESSTMRGRPGVPSGASRICLSCHDGTIALGQLRTRTLPMSAAAPGGRLPPGHRANLGTDLRATHPVSVTPAPPATLPRRVDARGQIQCTSCHDPHLEFAGTDEGKFLVQTTRRSRLCVECHADLPAVTPHSGSGARFGVAQGNAAGYASVGEAGCAACHVSHGAGAGGRLLAKGPGDEDDALCLRCHAGAVARADVGRDLAKPSAHRAGGRAVHDAAEGPEAATRRLPETSPGAPRHVVCVDCHEPHRAAAAVAAAPAVRGVNAGIWGIDRDGRRVEGARFEYELCFKCHGDSANKPQGLALGAGGVRRRAADANLRRVFDPAAPSSHPVVAPARGALVPSLRPPLTPASMIYCTDCHASNDGPGAGGGGARGPHGSIYSPLLERDYRTEDLTPESPAAYALCYKCHDRDVLLSPASAFPLHRRHVVEQLTPCSACHAAHGVSAVAGTSRNNAHLVDFDTAIARPGPRGLLEYASGGVRSGSCTLRCHGSDHDTARY